MKKAVLTALMAAAVLTGVLFGTAAKAEDVSVLFNNCDEITGWNNPVEGYAFKGIDTAEKKEGSGSVKFVLANGAQMMIMAALPMGQTVDASAADCLEFEFYISAADYLLQAQDCQVELTSSGTWDKDELRWAPTYMKNIALTTGWNHIKLPFKDGGMQRELNGTPAFKASAVNFFRFYATNAYKYSGQEVTVRVDNIRFTKLKEVQSSAAPVRSSAVSSRADAGSSVASAAASSAAASSADTSQDEPAAAVSEPGGDSSAAGTGTDEGTVSVPIWFIWVGAGIVLLLIAGGGFAAWYFLIRRKGA